MTNPNPDRPNSSATEPARPEPASGHLTRRQVLRAAGTAAGAAMVAGVGHAAQAGPVNLSSAEYQTLEAISARIIPADDNGPGAREAQAARYIDRALGGALSDALAGYHNGLSALDIYTNSAYSGSFTELSEDEQDEVLTALQDNDAPGFPGNSAQFFNLVRGHTIQGTFSDPFYGGNANFVGWDMIGYPGVRTAVPAELQQIDGDHTPNHQSVYDSSMFDEGEV